MVATIHSSISLGQEQYVLGSAGNHFTTPSVSIEYTVGEAVISTASVVAITLTQGFHQPNLKVFDPEGFEENEAGLINVFPNPVCNVLNIQLPLTNSPYQLLLLDPLGRTVFMSGLLPNELSKINFSKFASGTYYLCLTNLNNKISTNYKLLKTE